MALSENEKLKNRVLMAKASIPLYNMAKAFIERFPKYEDQYEEVRRMLQIRVVKEEMVKDLETWSKEWIEKMGNERQNHE